MLISFLPLFSASIPNLLRAPVVDEMLQTLGLSSMEELFRDIKTDLQVKMALICLRELGTP
jgi:glycine cleavage system pyridoxal-binding protein P